MISTIENTAASQMKGGAPRTTLKPGTCNVPLHMATEERSVWGRTTFTRRAKSVGRLMKEAALNGLARIDPPAALQILNIRRRLFPRQQHNIAALEAHDHTVRESKSCEMDCI
jgi:hypothetical protein